MVDTALGPRVLEKRCGGKGDRADSMAPVFVGDHSNLRTFAGQASPRTDNKPILIFNSAGNPLRTFNR